MEKMYGKNIFDLLKEDHADIKKTMKSIERTVYTNDDLTLEEAFTEFKKLFSAHDKIEDKIIYPALQRYPELEKLVLKCYQAHHMVHIGVLELRFLPYITEAWGAKFLVIQDNILHHMKEEEDFLFEKASKLMKVKELNNLKEEYIDFKVTS